MRRSVLVSSLAVFALVIIAGCMNSNSSTMSSKTLYDRLGGEPAITKVVDDFVGMAASDPKVNFARKGTPMEWNASAENVAMLKKHLVQFIATAAGGPQKYEGRDMKSAHKGMGISDVEFTAIAADLVAALDKNGVPQKEKDELMAVVATTKNDIVEKKM
jgi:hemoglobin